MSACDSEGALDMQDFMLSPTPCPSGPTPRTLT